MKRNTSQISSTVLTKLGMRREMKELAKGNLTDKDIQRLVENNRAMRHERLVKKLDAGATMHADVVMHPKHGLVVRKRLANPTRLAMGEIASHPDIGIYDDIKRLQKRLGRSGFARVHEVDPKTGLVFQELMKGKALRDERLGWIPGLEEGFKKLKKHMADADAARLRGDSAAARKHMRAMRKVNPLVGIGVRAIGMRPLDDWQLSGAQQNFLKELRKKHPRIWDYAAGQNLMRDAKGNLNIIDVAADQYSFNPPVKKGPWKPRDIHAQVRARAEGIPKKPPVRPGARPQYVDLTASEIADRAKGVSKLPKTKKYWLLEHLNRRNLLLGLGAAGLGYKGYQMYKDRQKDQDVQA